MPPLPQRTNSMPISVTPANISASWPAPLADRTARCRRCAMACANADCIRWRTRHGAHGGRFRTMVDVTRRRRAMLRIVGANVGDGRVARTRRRVERTSSDSSQRAGNDIDQPVRHRRADRPCRRGQHPPRTAARPQARFPPPRPPHRAEAASGRSPHARQRPRQ